jgi:hypothetical protein
MAVPKEPSCPFCNRLQTGVLLYDDDMNICCKHCKQVIFAVTEEAEHKIKQAIDKTTRTSGTYYNKKEPLPIVVKILDVS